MARIAAYLGPRTPVARLLEGGSYALTQQASEHPDGFGLAWYPDDDDAAPVRIVSELPASRAEALMSVPRRYLTECGVAALRGAGGHHYGLAGLQPFEHERYLFAFDGALDRYEEVFLRPLRDRLSDERYQALKTNEPAELLFATWLDALLEQEGEDADAMAAALEHMVGTVGDIATAAGVAASFAIVASNGACLLTLRAATHGPPPALYTIVAGPDAPVPESGRVVASEPLFPGAWSSLDPHSLVIFTIESASEENTDDLPTEHGARPAPAR